MSKKNLRYMCFLIVVIVFLFVCSAGMILLIKDANERKTPPVEDGDVSFVADSNTIIIKNIISVSEVFGKTIDEENGGAFGFLEFDVVNNTNLDRNFQVYITRQTPTTKEINPNYITFYLTDSSNIPFSEYTGNKMPSYDDFSYIVDKADSKSIFTGMLKPNEKAHFILRVWIADNFVIGNEEESFSFEIGARAI